MLVFPIKHAHDGEGQGFLHQRLRKLEIVSLQAGPERVSEWSILADFGRLRGWMRSYVPVHTHVPRKRDRNQKRNQKWNRNQHRKLNQMRSRKRNRKSGATNGIGSRTKRWDWLDQAGWPERDGLASRTEWANWLPGLTGQSSTNRHSQNTQLWGRLRPSEAI